ncbi:MAG TPA: hypothetical protein VGT99_06045 [Gammaproteobacteria bacterium]|nr:hypothetical protein [Gammaproteobacteria bacterium]
MQDSFLSYRHYRYLKLSIALLVPCIALYVLFRPATGPSGGTWVGYTLGGVGAAIIVFLLWFGVRKRQFGSSLGNVRGWLSAHVYLGAALPVIATLHCAFDFGWNVHTLAYALLLLVTASGFYGLYVYVRYPNKLTANRLNRPDAHALEEILQLDNRSLELAESIDTDTYQAVLRSVRRVRIGGNIWRQLRGGSRRARLAERKAHEMLLRQGMVLVSKIKSQGPGQMQAMQAGLTLKMMAERLATTGSGSQVETLRELMELMGRRRQLVQQLNEEIRLRAHLQVWLYVHVPLSTALLAALVAHVVAVFFYW